MWKSARPLAGRNDRWAKLSDKINWRGGCYRVAAVSQAFGVASVMMPRKQVFGARFIGRGGREYARERMRVETNRICPGLFIIPTAGLSLFLHGFWEEKRGKKLVLQVSKEFLTDSF